MSGLSARPALSRWTAGLAGERDPAQPLLTLLDGPARVELSGATTANWVAKSANLLVDGLGAPTRVGLLLPLHWQAVALLLAGAATGATVVIAARPEELAGCGAAFTTVDGAPGALDAGVDEVLALSGHPLGAPCGPLPAGVTDYAREVPSYGDHWGGPPPAGWQVEVGGGPLGALPQLGLTAADRLLVTTPPAERAGLAALLGALQAGAALLLVSDPSAVALEPVAADERVTAAHGVAVPGVRRVG